MDKTDGLRTLAIISFVLIVISSIYPAWACYQMGTYSKHQTPLIHSKVLGIFEPAYHDTFRSYGLRASFIGFIGGLIAFIYLNKSGRLSPRNKKYSCFGLSIGAGAMTIYLFLIFLGFILY